MKNTITRIVLLASLSWSRIMKKDVPPSLQMALGCVAVLASWYGYTSLRVDRVGFDLFLFLSVGVPIMAILSTIILVVFSRIRRVSFVLILALFLPLGVVSFGEAWAFQEERKFMNAVAERDDPYFDRIDNYYQKTRRFPFCSRVLYYHEMIGLNVRN